MSGALITIITGTPGAGKTSLAVSMILEHLEKNPERPVFACGINELALPHEVVPPAKDWTVIRPHPDDPDVDFPEFTFPDGALIVIDEAQNFFRPRASSAKVPDHVAALERHRHKGLDFILLTQGPGLIDTNVRMLCGKYIHLRKGWFGGQLLEWNEIANPMSSADRSNAVRRRFKPPKQVFELYKSSSMHVKNKSRMHWGVYVLVAALVGIAYFGHMFWQFLGGALDTELEPPTTSEATSAPHAAVEDQRSSAGTLPQGQGSGAPLGSRVEDYVPRLPQRPETAPLYDGIRQVRAMPTVSGCVAMENRCKCYTSQATDAFLTEEQCRAWIENPPFDPWKGETSQQVAQQDQPRHDPAETAYHDHP